MMDFGGTLRGLLGLVCCLLTGALVGCQSRGPGSEADWERSASYTKATRLAESGDFKGAAAEYKRTVRDLPDFAKAHLELGLICDDKLGDPISAIYHYRRYLELQPNSSKKQLVEDFIERAKLSLASKLPQSPIIDPAELSRLQTEKANLMQENISLKARVAELERGQSSTLTRVTPPVMVPTMTVTTVAPMVSVATTSSSVTVAPPPVASRARVHVVQKGDTLYSLAAKYYGSGANWERIYQANRSTMPNKTDLKIGQELVIP